jgi:hypothetical protein
VDGQVIESDGKTENAQHVLALDPFTLAALKAHVEQLDQERRELDPDYQDHGVLFCWEDGRPPHPDTITRRFTQLAAAAEAARAMRTKEHHMTCNAAAGNRIVGTLRTADDKGVVRMEDHFDTGIYDLWSALTDPGHLARWLGEFEGDLRLGACIL